MSCIILYKSIHNSATTNDALTSDYLSIYAQRCYGAANSINLPFVSLPAHSEELKEVIFRKRFSIQNNKLFVSKIRSEYFLGMNRALYKLEKAGCPEGQYYILSSVFEGFCSPLGEKFAVDVKRVFGIEPIPIKEADVLLVPKKENEPDVRPCNIASFRNTAGGWAERWEYRSGGFNELIGSITCDKGGTVRFNNSEYDFEAIKSYLKECLTDIEVIETKFNVSYNLYVAGKLDDKS